MNPCRVSAITNGGRERTIRTLSSRIDLEAARVVAGGELDGLGRGLDVREPHDPPLGLRDRLLRDDDDVVVLEAARALGGGGEVRGEVVPRLQLGDPGEPEDPEVARDR